MADKLILFNVFMLPHTEGNWIYNTIAVDWYGMSHFYMFSGESVEIIIIMTERTSKI